LFDKTPFYAAAQMITQGLRWRGEEPGDVRSAQLYNALQTAGLDVSEAFPLVAELLGLSLPAGAQARSYDAEEKRERLLAALARWTLNSARDQFLVVAVEDLHWVDPSTIELLALIAEQAEEARLLLIGTARPEFRAPWTMRAHHAQVTLSRLRRAQVAEIVCGTMEAAGLASSLIDDVITRADGVPLFAEELARLMLESRGQAGPHDIPETLQDSLMARLDRLGQAKETAQIGAVLGREFGYDMLRSLSPLSDDELRLTLAKLVEADLLYADGAGASATYRFKHSLVQDAAYDALLKRQRRSLHARVAHTIGERLAAVAEAHPEILAHHWAEAGEADKAVEAWTKSAKNAAARYAYKESSDAFQRALATLATSAETAERDASELQLWRWFVGAAQIAYGYSAPETRQATKMARRLAEKTGDVRKQFAQIAGEWMAASSAGDHRASRRLAEQVLPLAHAQATPDSLATAHMIMLTSRFRLGDLGGAEDSYAVGEPFFSAAEFVRRPGAAAQAFGNGAMTAWVMGNIPEARRRVGAVHDLMRRSENPYELAFSQYMAAMVALMLGDLEEAEGLARKSIELSNRGRFPQFAATSSIVLGRVLAERGLADEGLPLMLEGLRGMARNRSRTLLTMYLTWLASTRHACGQADLAMQTAEQALTINPQEKFFRPESLRVRAELRLASHERAHAGEDLRRAVNLAKAMRADLLRQRAAASLAASLAAE
ncbi:MAG TPA: hypothetical protein VEF55_13355, partial [Candidatus Binatia bacterium]|nr:hypothetical protein [Candidatus Binatia bacterium]